MRGLRAPQLPVVNRALLTAFGSRTKRIKRQALIEFEIVGVSYEQVFMIAPDVIRVVIVGINFLKENNVVISVAEGHGSDCEHKFFYDSLPKNKAGIGFISKPKIQLNFSNLRSRTERVINWALRPHAH